MSAELPQLPDTVEECHQVIRFLMNKLDELTTRLDALELENKKLREENTQLKERLNNNSSNSSLPPSKSFKKPKNTPIERQKQWWAKGSSGPVS